MTEPEQPDTPPLTRKQMRELRNTGATPVITAADVASAQNAAPVEHAPEPEPEQAPEPDPIPEPAPLPRPAEPTVVAPAPIPDSAVDLGVAPLTRRQARQQERIRTASVPVITPEIAAAHAASAPALITEAPAPDDAATITEDLDEWFAPENDDVVQQEAPDVEVEADVDAEPISPVTDDEDDEDDRVLVNPALGEALIAGAPVEIDLPPSFDQLLARGSGGAAGTPNALILSQTTGDLPIVAPISATGEVIVTGTFNLPEGLGSTGHAPGTADGKDVDSVLIDGELPAHSSPTPISASAAISTVKSAGEVIRPPAPEKGGRLMLWLAITAGALALALVGVLVLAFVNGVFS